MHRADDVIYMQRCIELAGRGLGYTWPNPLVGSVIVKDSMIIGEGYHIKAGGPHAEVVAIESVADRSLLKGATLYVSLEPCSHYGRTPPCTDKIIASGIRRVVIGTTDTSSRVSGRGIEALRNAGCEVSSGVCEGEARWVNRRYFTYIEKERPYVILKWAMSNDGYIDTERPPGMLLKPYWITGMTERILVHRWRSSEQVILVGGATVRADDPVLNVRYWGGIDPVKVIVSKTGQVDSRSKVFSGGKALLFTAARDLSVPGAEIINIDCSGDELPALLLGLLHDMGYQSVFIEGGRKIHDVFIASGLWDEARIFSGNINWGRGLAAPRITGRITHTAGFVTSSLKVLINE